jgi:Uma2 family endonuclease
MGDAAKRRATYEDVLAAPRHMVAEVVAGVLHTQPRPGAPHARAASRLGGKLSGPFDEGRGGPGGWILLDEPELHLGPEPDIVVPDMAGWRRERMPRLPMQDAFFSLAPDWICEVLSPSTQAFDRGEKMDLYAREGVAHAWLVDPLARMVEVFRLEREKWVRLGTWRDDARVHAEPFEVFELELGALWAD